mgnify:CR=1 FL=1|jgi:hypothetical protein
MEHPKCHRIASPRVRFLPDETLIKCIVLNRKLLKLKKIIQRKTLFIKNIHNKCGKPKIMAKVVLNSWAPKLFPYQVPIQLEVLD